METSLAGKVALVAGATRGAGRGIAVQLGAAGATVYCTGRTTRSERSEMNRPETIEETAALVDEAGGRGIAIRVDHLVPDEVAALVSRIEAEQGALHVLVNDIWGATTMEWDRSVWESTLDVGLHTLRLAIDTHAITSHFALPLLIKAPGGLVVEVTDGTGEYNATNYRVSFFYDLAKAANLRMAFALAHELQPHGATAVSLTPGWLRSEAMLEALASPNRTGVTPRSACPTSPSPRARRSSVEPSRHWPEIPTCRAGTDRRCPAGNWPRSTGSPISTAASPTPGATSPKCRTRASPPTRPAIADTTTAGARCRVDDPRRRWPCH
jgi:NAD(P)-dependent dehydrogenase (short-subunit alcohol dehydrogenase family)